MITAFCRGKSRKRKWCALQGSNPRRAGDIRGTGPARSLDLPLQQHSTKKASAPDGSRDDGGSEVGAARGASGDRLQRDDRQCAAAARQMDATAGGGGPAPLAATLYGQRHRVGKVASISVVNSHRSLSQGTSGVCGERALQLGRTNIGGFLEASVHRRWSEPLICSSYCAWSPCRFVSWSITENGNVPLRDLYPKGDGRRAAQAKRRCHRGLFGELLTAWKQAAMVPPCISLQNER